MTTQARTRTGQGILVDLVEDTPVDLHQRRFRRRLLIALGVVLVLALGWLAWRFGSDRPSDYASIDDQFKYGSIGSEPGGSLRQPIGGVLPPYKLFVALPGVCPDLLPPGGYAGLGLIFEKGRDLPIGVSRRFRLGLEQVGLNCAICHAGTVRGAAAEEPRIVLGMPAHQLDLQALFRFLIDCALDERFEPDRVLGEIRAAGLSVGPLERAILRRQVIPAVREQSLALRNRLDPILSSAAPAWGRGRVDTFNPYKALQMNWKLSALPPGELVAASDFPAIWNQKPREGMQLHWDGNNSSVDERNLSAALGTGVTPVTIDHQRLERVREWIWDELPPPAYPWPIDAARAQAAKPLYARYCAECHGHEGFRDGVFEKGKLGQVTAIGEIQTDPQRLDAYTYVFSANQYMLYPSSKYRFRHFRKTNGYANQPLDGIWARAPYLHNGSVPTLRDLLEPPERRPVRFYRGNDLYDQQRVGFVSSAPSEERGGVRLQYSLFDTAVLGNSNSGHRYGTELSAAEKDALVEYLKTF